MNVPNRSRLFAAGAIALGLLGAASAAQARTDVYFSLGVPVYTAPAPVYVQPQPVYVDPAPAYVAPAPIFVRPRRAWADDDGWRRAEWRRERWERRREWEHRHRVERWHRD
jgi:hypothetical protein